MAPPFSILRPNAVFNLPPAKNAIQNKQLPTVRAVRLKNIVLRATAAIFADPWEILQEIPVYGVNGLYARHKQEDNDDWLLPSNTT
ncbi:MAG: hypothetical protein AB1461_08980 [Thermodesulfobacteriota bacterium]